MFTLTPSDYTDIYRNLDYMDNMYDTYDHEHPDLEKSVKNDEDAEKNDESTDFPGLEQLPVLRLKLGEDESAVQAYHMANFWINCLGYKELPDNLPDEMQMDRIHRALFNDTDLRIVLLDVKKNVNDPTTTRMVVARTCL
jgi:hypothetical protein